MEGGGVVVEVVEAVVVTTAVSEAVIVLSNIVCSLSHEYRATHDHPKLEPALSGMGSPARLLATVV